MDVFGEKKKKSTTTSIMIALVKMKKKKKKVVGIQTLVSMCTNEPLLMENRSHCFSGGGAIATVFLACHCGIVLVVAISSTVYSLNM